MYTAAVTTEAPELWDYVFVVDRRTQRNPRQVQRRRQFLEELENQGFRYKVGVATIPGSLSEPQGT